jgi:hypothetical protein
LWTWLRRKEMESLKTEFIWIQQNERTTDGEECLRREISSALFCIFHRVRRRTVEKDRRRDGVSGNGCSGFGISSQGREREMFGYFLPKHLVSHLEWEKERYLVISDPSIWYFISSGGESKMVGYFRVKHFTLHRVCQAGILLSICVSDWPCLVTNFPVVIVDVDSAINGKGESVFSLHHPGSTNISSARHFRPKLLSWWVSCRCRRN